MQMGEISIREAVAIELIESFGFFRQISLDDIRALTCYVNYTLKNSLKFPSRIDKMEVKKEAILNSFKECQ